MLHNQKITLISRLFSATTTHHLPRFHHSIESFWRSMTPGSSYVLYRDGRDLDLRAADQTRNLPRNRSCISPHLANRTSAATRISAEESAGLHQSDRFPAWDRALPASQSAALSASACREWLRSSGLAQSSLPASGRYSASVCQGDPR